LEGVDEVVITFSFVSEVIEIVPVRWSCKHDWDGPSELVSRIVNPLAFVDKHVDFGQEEVIFSA
jgi:hypothetical protein